MYVIDPMFVLIVKFSALAFALLALGMIALRWLKQPVERIRLVQVTLAAVFIAAIVGYGRWIPPLELAWLPGDTASEVSAPTEPNITTHRIIEPVSYTHLTLPTTSRV